MTPDARPPFVWWAFGMFGLLALTLVPMLALNAWALVAYRRGEGTASLLGRICWVLSVVLMWSGPCVAAGAVGLLVAVLVDSIRAPVDEDPAARWPRRAAAANSLYALCVVTAVVVWELVVRRLGVL